ncbi:MAG: PDZ domain-containing protein [Sphingobacterium sp.]|nr:PDZ domain-containing protein [Sphingobacterium sp.]
MRIGDIGVLPKVHPSIRSLEAERPADKAGLKVEDVVLALDGEPIVFSGQLSAEIRKHPEEAITLTVAAGRRDARRPGDAAPAGRDRPHRHRHPGSVPDAFSPACSARRS